MGTLHPKRVAEFFQSHGVSNLTEYQQRYGAQPQLSPKGSSLQSPSDGAAGGEHQLLAALTQARETIAAIVDIMRASPRPSTATTSRKNTTLVLHAHSQSATSSNSQSGPFAGVQGGSTSTTVIASGGKATAPSHLTGHARGRSLIDASRSLAKLLPRLQNRVPTVVPAVTAFQRAFSHADRLRESLATKVKPRSLTLWTVAP